MDISLIVPTYNAGPLWDEWLDALDRQTIMPDCVQVIDSSSHDDTVSKARSRGIDVTIIPSSEFNHGGTRNRALNLVCPSDVVMFLTQDAIFADQYSIERIIRAFCDSDVGAAYGRQLPRQRAGPIEAHARLFNYPKESYVVGSEDIHDRGLRTVFISNSFAAYRVEALKSVGGFPDNTIFAEDMHATARMVIKGWKVAYCADATVYHSHAYSVLQEFKRYFDIGVFHSRESWIQEKFSGAGGEGLRFVVSELAYLAKCAPWLIPEAIFRTVAKYVGYKIGQKERYLSLPVKRKLSMHSRYWDQEI